MEGREETVSEVIFRKQYMHVSIYTYIRVVRFWRVVRGHWWMVGEGWVVGWRVGVEGGVRSHPGEGEDGAEAQLEMKRKK